MYAPDSCPEYGLLDAMRQSPDMVVSDILMQEKALCVRFFYHCVIDPKKMGCSLPELFLGLICQISNTMTASLERCIHQEFPPGAGMLVYDTCYSRIRHDMLTYC